MVHHLLLKLPFARRGSAQAQTVPLISAPSKSSSTAVIATSPDPPLSSLPVSSLSSIAESYYSAPPMPYTVSPLTDARPASATSRRPANLFKRFLRKEHSFSSLAAYKSRPDQMGKELRRLHTSTVPEDRERDPQLKTPISPHKLHWDYAKTV